MKMHGKEKNMKKNLKYAMTTAAVTVLMLGAITITEAAPSTTNPTSTPTATTGWVEKTEGKETIFYYYENGQMIKNNWKQSPASGLWYFFDGDGVMVTGWGEGKADGYYFEPSGAMATGWRQVSFEDSYGPASNSGDKGWYYFGTSGMMNLGWKKLGENWYYFNDGDVNDFEEGQMLYGEITMNGDEYYFGGENDGIMKTGLVKVVDSIMGNTPSSSTSDDFYFYGDDGIKVIDGWGKANNNWYYIDEDGLVAKGFIGFNSKGEYVDAEDADAIKIYYMNDQGIMHKGWLDLGEAKETRPGYSSSKQYYYFDNDGIMQTGWLKESSKWYYLATEKDDRYNKGQMRTGLLNDIPKDSNTYYLNDNGEMATSTWKTIEDGGDHDIYLGSDGKMHKASSADDLLVERINGKYYVIDTNGYKLTNTTVYDIGNKGKYKQASESEVPSNTKTYTINRNGVATSGKTK